MEIVDRGVDQLILKSGLDAVPPDNLREDDLGIGDKRILKLRIAAGAAERGKSAVQVRGEQAALERRISRLVGNIELRCVEAQCWVAFFRATV